MLKISISSPEWPSALKSLWPSMKYLEVIMHDGLFRQLGGGVGWGGGIAIVFPWWACSWLLLEIFSWSFTDWQARSTVQRISGQRPWGTSYVIMCTAYIFMQQVYNSVKIMLTLIHIFYPMQYMYKTLLEWSLHNNRETMKLALPALEAFLYEVNLMIVNIRFQWDN